MRDSSAFFSASFFLRSSIPRCFHVLLRNFIGRLPTYFPSNSFIALIKSCGSLKLMNPYPFVLLDFLSRTTLALTNDGNLLNVRVSNSSLTSLPKSPQKMRKSSSSHSKNQKMVVVEIHTNL